MTHRNGMIKYELVFGAELYVAGAGGRRCHGRSPPCNGLPSFTLVDLAAVEGKEARVLERCHSARKRAATRQGKTNQALARQEIDTHAQLNPAALQFLQSTAAKLGWSFHVTHRALKIARTIADLAGSDNPQLTHVTEAMQYRRVLQRSS